MLLVRKGNDFTTKNTSNLIIHDLSKSHHIHSNLNLMHQNQIISNYQNNEIHVEFDKTSQEDNLRVNPSPTDEQHFTEIEYKSKTTDSIVEIEKKVIDLISTSTIIKTLTGAFTTLIIIVLLFKVALLIIKNCFKTKRLPVQSQRLELTEAQVWPLHRYELAKQTNSIV